MGWKGFSEDDTIMKHDLLLKIIPGLRWLQGYNIQYAFADFIAGVTVGLTVIPQCLAYSILAGLEPQYGLYSSFLGGIIYTFLGGCRQVTIGPTALLALMTSRHTGLGGPSGPHYAILLCFLAGIVQMLMALLKLGALVDLISLPVSVGFTSATAVIIGASQINGLLGLKGGSGSNFVPTIKTVIENINKTRTGDLCLGLSSIAVLLALRKLKDFKIKSTSKYVRALNGTMWVIGISRNALVVFVTSLVSFSFARSGQQPFILTGTVQSGMPTFNLPSFHTQILDKNGALVEQSFIDMINELGASIVLVPIIAVLGNVAISQAFGGVGLNPTRELIALSLSNVFGSFVSSFPVTGSFSRSAVNHASGVKTPIGGIYTSVLVLLAIGILTPYFHYIPKAALSAVIISAVIFMIEYEVIKPLWRCSKRELLPGAVTFIFSLWLGVEIGLLIGVTADVGFLVHRAARPVLSIGKCHTESGYEYVLIRPKHSLLYFPATEHVRSGISKAVQNYGILPVVLDCRNLNEFDFTAARGIGSLHKDLTEKKIIFILLGATSEVRHVLKEATNIPIGNIDDIEDLEPLLAQDPDHGLKSIVMPLLKGSEDTINGKVK